MTVDYGERGQSASGENQEHAPSWQSIRLANGCANLLCENRPGEGQFTLLIEQRPNVARAVSADEEIVVPSFGPPMVLYVCSPCAAVLRGEAR